MGNYVIINKDARGRGLKFVVWHKESYGYSNMPQLMTLKAANMLIKRYKPCDAPWEVVEWD